MCRSRTCSRRNPPRPLLVNKGSTRLRYSLRMALAPEFQIAFDIYKLDMEPTPLRLETSPMVSTESTRE